MKKLMSVFCLLLLSFNAYSAPVEIDPGITLYPDEGPFGYGGRGVVFRAEQDFSMSSFGMDLNFPGTLDFHVTVYAISGTSRGSLISETAYPGMTDDGSEFFTLAHSQDFIAGNTYEIIMKFSDPGVILPHYNFSNPSLLPGSGFMVGTDMLILDGSDFDTGGLNNSWLARFQINATSGVAPRAPMVPVPTLSFWGLAALILAIFAIVMRNRRFISSRR